MKNGNQVVKTAPLSAGNNWTAEIEVPKYDSLGKEINYAVDEVDLGNKFYKKTGITGDMTGGYTITNTFEVPDETVSVPVTKVWNDNNNKAEKRPESVTLKLTGNGQEYTHELTKEENPENANNWTYTFTRLPKYNRLGNEIQYTVSEEEITGTEGIFYTEENTEISGNMTEGYTITNTFEVPGDTINVPIVKVWDDNNNNAGKRPESIIVRIQGDTNTEQAGNEINKTETINTSNVVQGNANNWAYTFTGLPKYNELGNEVEYKVTEEKIEGTSGIFYTAENTQITGDTKQGYTITNTFEVPDEKISVQVTKNWIDTTEQKDKRPETITVVLNGNGKTEEQEITASKNWKHTFSNLAKYDSLGNEIQYTVEEKETGNKFYTKENSKVEGTQEEGYVITNKFAVPDEKTSVTVTKVWDDNSNEAGRRPSNITITLTGDTNPSIEGNDINKTQTITAATNINPSNSNEWKYTFENLPKYDTNGDEVEYTIDEEGTNSEFYQKTEVNQEERRIINTFQVPGETVNVRVTKQWNDNNNEAQKRPPNVTIQVKNGEQVVQSGIVNVGNNWTYNFTLPKYNSLGQEINYTADEVDLGNTYYKKTGIEGDMATGYTITNTFEVPDDTINVPVTKVWNDSNNKAQKRPESVTMVLTATSTTPEQIPEEYREIRQTLTDSNVNETDANKWNYTFSNLPRYDDYGNEITYLLSEEKIEGTSGIFYTAENTEITGNMTEGYTVTNTFEVPNDTISVPVTKVWNDNSNKAGKRPESITLRIQGDTNTEQTGNEINKTQTLSTSNAVQGNTNNWVYTFTGLPKYNELGNEVEYTVTEEKIEGTAGIFYTVENTQIAGDTKQGYTITNTFEVPEETVNVPVTKVWNDNSNKAGKRPVNVTVRIQGDTNTAQAGNEINKTQTLSTSNAVEGNTNNWAYTFTGLPKYNELGNEVEYTVTEEKIEGTAGIFYTEENTQITRDTKQGYTITNRFEVPDEKVTITVTKVWDDNSNEAGRRPESIVLTLMGDTNPEAEGNEITRRETITKEANVNPSNGNEWTYTFENLPKYDVNGDEVEYTIDEEGTNSEFYQKVSVDQETRRITNKFVVPGETVKVRVTKEWNDNNNQAQKRPTNVTLQVKNGKEIAGEQVVNAENNWTNEFTLPKYNSLGQEINYTAGEKDLKNIYYTAQNSI